MATVTATRLPALDAATLQKCWLTATLRRRLSSAALNAAADKLETSAPARAAMLKEARRFDKHGVMARLEPGVWPLVVEDIRRRAYQVSPAGRAELRAMCDAAEATSRGMVA